MVDWMKLGLNAVGAVSHHGGGPAFAGACPLPPARAGQGQGQGRAGLA